MLKPLRNLLTVPLLCVCCSLFSQNKTLQAAKTLQPPVIDGVLDEEVWQSAPVAENFIQNFPNAGKPASRNTAVRVLYDNSAVYIGAYLYDDPSLIRKQLTARDGEQKQDVDYFSVFIDTYNDDQNGFQFLVTSANVQSDARIGPNLQFEPGEYGDKTWQAVWESRVGIRKDGWVVEMRIPFLSLRFAKKEEQDWGINFLRYIRRVNESDFWNKVDPAVSGFVNQFGTLRGLLDIKPPLRLSFSPYVTAGYRATPVNGSHLHDFLKNGGMDVKYGINESFTLDATLIPDFGQVISDNLVQNLTPYEVQFQENRPFFTEGTELFNKAGIFYSRRIGAIPGKYQAVKNFTDTTDWEIEKNSSVTNLYNAVKFSGRNKKNFGIGIFNAVTAPVDARIHNSISGADSSIRTEPLANYTILVLDKAFQGQSYLTFTNASTIRHGLGRDANVSSLDFALFDKQNRYGLSGTAKYSRIFQNSGSYDGFNTSLRFARVSGNWQYNLSGNILSDRYDPNDLGILPANNTVTYRGGITYKKFTPTPAFISYSYSLLAIGNYLYRPYSYARTDLVVTGVWVLRNFWDFTIQGVLNPGKWKDFFELRRPGEYYLNYPLNYSITMNGNTDSRRKALLSFGGAFARTPDLKTQTLVWQLGLRFRFNEKFSLSLNGDKTKAVNYIGNGFITGSSGGAVAANRNIRQMTSLFSGIYNFTPRMNLTLRVRHYWLKLVAKEFYDVSPVDGSLALNSAYYPTPLVLFNQNYFNLDAFLTWDFRLGSRIIVGWKNWLGEDESVNGTVYKNYGSNLERVLFNLRHGNELTFRFIYFLDYNKLKRKG